MTGAAKNALHYYMLDRCVTCKHLEIDHTDAMGPCKEPDCMCIAFIKYEVKPLLCTTCSHEFDAHNPFWGGPCTLCACPKLTSNL